MDFLKWLTINEARGYGGAGGAFGRESGGFSMKQPFDRTSPAPRNVPAGTGAGTGDRFDDRASRVTQGMKIEKQIFQSLLKCGMELTEPTVQQDMHDKIDAFWKTPSGQKAIQIKYRDTGDDILFEVMKDYRRGIPGRDMIGKAEFYAVMDRTGKIVLVSLNDAKNLIKDMQARAEKEGFDERGNYRMGKAMLRVRPDPNTQQDKLMAYIPVSMLKQILPPCYKMSNEIN